MFLSGTILLEVAKRIFLPNNIEIGLMESNKTFKVFNIQVDIYRGNKPCLLWPCFFMNKLTRGSSNQQFCSYIEIGPKVSDKKTFKVFHI